MFQRRSEVIEGVRLATIILAAGLSKRMGRVNKLLIPIDGLPMIRRVMDAAIEAGSTDIYVVTGFERERIESCLTGYVVNFVYNESFRSGMGTSIAEGIKAIARRGFEGAMILLGDLPYLKSATLNTAASAFSENLDRKIIVPEFDGKPGHPVVFPESRFDELARLSGDHGAKKLIANHWSDVLRITVDDPGSIRDLDTLSE